MASHKALQPLRGIRIVSLALNLPGPAALMRLKAMGARCTKIESPAGDPMALYSPEAYAQMHAGIARKTLDLKTEAGQRKLHVLLAQTDVLLTSFRPSALHKLGLDAKALRKSHPRLSCVQVVGGAGDAAEEPGHDLTYLAQHGLVTGLDLPATLYADMAGSLAASEAVLKAVLHQRTTDKASVQQISLGEAARYLALPRHWQLTTPKGFVGGAHAGYRVYACKDGRVAVAALEPHFAKRLCEAADIQSDGLRDMLRPATQRALTQWFASHTRRALTHLALQRDIPFFCTK
jgi:alpha-methylacyl-CoA racemase